MMTLDLEAANSNAPTQLYGVKDDPYQPICKSSPEVNEIEASDDSTEPLASLEICYDVARSAAHHSASKWSYMLMYAKSSIAIQ